MERIFNFIGGVAVGMTLLSMVAVYHTHVEVEQLLERTSSLEDRVVEVEQQPVEIYVADPKPTRPQPRPDNLVAILKTNQTMQYESLDVFCLAKNIFHEAGVEDRVGKYAVAQVTLNRVKNPKYPDTVCEVVMDRFQFSWANDRKIRWTHPKGKTWEESKEIARKVLAEGYRLQGLEQANYYHADYVKPKWKKPEAKIAQIGTHIFYASAR